ncbi:glucosidase [Salipiger aestuarii]|uniref:Glycosyl hydrolase family 63 n=1 Tax=Salipiger aestuarii TaxID=568098 RepID=A0A327YFI8_9RHOB|nr:glucosidase [Salipiger aestuarii]KAB2542996.1 glucosidase [Salipiger aestuarii]RAK19624.1 glycosyl hydrolase family 63 [Salipiger aestuarii]
MTDTAEDKRLNGPARADWMRWGPYLSERQWGTVREDYSEGGTAWDHLPHDNARSQAYRWGEDGIAGLSDDRQRLCLSLALWNGNDPILKERMYGLTNDQGNHGEDVKEYYFYQDSTPTHSYMKMLYKYPHSAFPYSDLMAENAHRKATDSAALEYELMDTGLFDEDRYFDIGVEYAKRSADDILVRITATNRGPEPHPIWLLPTLVFRNTWSWRAGSDRPEMSAVPTPSGSAAIETRHSALGTTRLICPEADALLFVENETNTQRLYGVPGPTFPKDGINDHLLHGAPAVNPDQTGTKAAAIYRRDVAPGQSVRIVLRLAADGTATDLGPDADGVFAARLAEADAFYAARLPTGLTPDRADIARQAHAGMLWSKQFFHFVVADWLDGDDVPPPAGRHKGRNAHWRHFYSEDIISMPDTWEYPWFASWDLCFHTIALARTDLTFAKEQVMLLCREWFMKPDGQVPAYEWAFDDVNPPLQVWAGLKIAEYELETFGTTDHAFMRRLFDHSLLYFTWWVNRKDAEGNNLFQGGFLGLDNISVFDRSSGNLPGGGRLYQSDGTTWVGFFALQMMQMAQKLQTSDPAYAEMASKFFQHFVFIADSLDHLGRESDGLADLWSEEDGLYFDVLRIGDDFLPLKARSLVSLIPMIAVAALDLSSLNEADDPLFRERLDWFRREQDDLLGKAAHGAGEDSSLLLSFVGRDRLIRLLGPMLDEAEFLSPYGIRSLSRRHLDDPFSITIEGGTFDAGYQPAESHSGMFGGNSNWRGPIWIPMNYILIDALRTHHAHYGDTLRVECPTGSGQMMTLDEVADDIAGRLAAIFERDPAGNRPVYGGTTKMQNDPHWRDNILFYEYFHGDIGAGIGASHQTGWTGLVAVLVESLAQAKATQAAVTVPLVAAQKASVSAKVA